VVRAAQALAASRTLPDGRVERSQLPLVFRQDDLLIDPWARRDGKEWQQSKGSIEPPLARAVRYTMCCMTKYLGSVFVTAVVAVISSLLMQPAEADSSIGGGAFRAVTPFRLVDTDTGVGGPATPLSAGESRSYQVAGVQGVPSTNVSAVVIDISATSLTGASTSSLRVFQSGGVRSDESSLLRFSAGYLPVSNTGIIPVGDDGRISVYNLSGMTDFNVDVQGYFTQTSDGSSQGGFVATPPTRVANTNDGSSLPQSGLQPNTPYEVTIPSSLVPAGASAVFANVKVWNASVDGGLRVAAGGSSATTPASVSYQEGRYTDSGMTIPLSPDGDIMLRNLTSGTNISVAIDIQGYFTGAASDGELFTPLGQQNIYDTAAIGSALAGNEERTIDVSGVAGLPSEGLGSAVMTVTVSNFTENGAVVVYPGNMNLPGTSNVTFTAGNYALATSSAIVEPAYGSLVTIKNKSSASVNVRLTAQGYFAEPDTDTDATVDIDQGDATQSPTPAVQLISEQPLGGSSRLQFSPNVSGAFSLEANSDGTVTMRKDGVVAGSFTARALDGDGDAQFASLTTSGSNLLEDVSTTSGTTYPVAVFPLFVPADPNSVATQASYGQSGTAAAENVEVAAAADAGFASDLTQPESDSNLGANGEFVSTGGCTPPKSCRSSVKPYVKVPAGHHAETHYYYDPDLKRPQPDRNWRKPWHDYCTKSPDTYGPASFRGPCARHDLCIEFKLGLDRDYCDHWLKDNMRVNCRNAFGKYNPDRYGCYNRASIYFWVVNHSTKKQPDKGHWGHSGPSSYPTFVGGPM
jgi:hypothetical protein